MSAREVIAFVGVSPGQAVASDIDAVRAGEYLAVLRSCARPFQWAGGRKGIIKDAAARAAALEALMPIGTVLPVMPKTFVKTAHLPDVPTANAPFFERLKGRLDGRVQFQIKIDWNGDCPLTKLSDARGLRSADTVDGLRIRLEERLSRALDDVVVEHQDLPLGKSGLINRVCLIEGQKEQELDAAIEHVDALWTEGLRIRLVGPSPAVSFASIALARQGPAQIAKAKSVLGLGGAPSASEIRTARRKALVSGAGKNASRIRAAAEILEAVARTSPGSSAPVYLARLWAEGQAEPPKDAEAA